MPRPKGGGGGGPTTRAAPASPAGSFILIYQQMPEPRLCLVLPHVLLGGGETAMMEIAEGLRRELALDVCALDNAATGGAPTVREELVARFGQVRFVRERWQLRPLLAAADVVLWYGV